MTAIAQHAGTVFAQKVQDVWEYVYFQQSVILKALDHGAWHLSVSNVEGNVVTLLQSPIADLEVHLCHYIKGCKIVTITQERETGLWEILLDVRGQKACQYDVICELLSRAPDFEGFYFDLA